MGRSSQNDGHYFCGAGGNRPDGLNETLTYIRLYGVQLTDLLQGFFRQC
ncbi:copper resistance protein [Shigella flexneri]|nr:copper resistance protein [Shigella flexneri]